jgi:hypothetical protein
MVPVPHVQRRFIASREQVCSRLKRIKKGAAFRSALHCQGGLHRFPRANRARQTAVVVAILFVPKGQTQL